MAPKISLFLTVMSICVVLCLVFFIKWEHVKVYIHGVKYLSEEKIGAPCQAIHSDKDNGPKPFLIPDDEELQKMNSSQLFSTYFKYINTLQVLCVNQTRVGSIKDGGKEVCLDNKYKPREKCIVYSFGSNNQFDFEDAVKARFNCEIHTFDPSRGNKKWSISSSTNFHDIGLGGVDETNKQGWKLQQLSSIVKDLGHAESTIDLLKIDVEGAEWPALPQMMESGVLKRVKQICIELHYQANSSENRNYLRSLRALYEYGFHMFMHERNPNGGISNGMTPVNEISVINVNWKV